MAKNPGHRPRRNTPEQVDRAVDQMIAEYEETGDVGALDDTRLMQILGNISPGTLERYYQGKADRALDDAEREADTEGIEDREYGTKERYSEALKKLVAYRRRVCVQHIATDRVTSGWIFLSKQPHWGGFQDTIRQESKGVQDVRITIAGPDGKPLR